MIKKIVLIISSLFLLSPAVAFCGWREKAALWAYFDALSKGSVKQVGALLSANFEYLFYRNNKLIKLGRNDELKSLERLFKDVPSNTFDLPDLFAEDKKDRDKLELKDWNKFKIILTIVFEDSPKVYTDSFFRGAMLEINETLIVTVDDDNKISKIVEVKDARRKNKLSFGYLKAIHVKELESRSRDANGPVTQGSPVEGDLISELFDKNNHELLLMSIQKDSPDGGIRETFYWPNKRGIENFE
jgi:hypothetical protein